MKCPECQCKVIELSHRDVRGGVLLCEVCGSVSPYAPTTTQAISLWEKRHLTSQCSGRVIGALNQGDTDSEPPTPHRIMKTA